MEIILVPGLWLDASCWREVVPRLEEAGHRTHPLTLPGMEDRAADRSRITLEDQVDAVVAAIDRSDGAVLLVGHSVGCAIAHGALDARPDRVARAVHIGGFPAPDGQVLLGGLPAVCPEYTAADLRSWIAAGEEMIAELARIRSVDYVDLPGGHWPQLTQPAALSRVILDAAATAASQRS